MKHIISHFLLLFLAGGFHLSAQTADIGGTVTTPLGTPIPNVEITLSSDALSSPITIMTNNLGQYLFEDLDTGFDYQLDVFKEDEPLNGLSIADLVLMRNFILAVLPWPNNFTLYAGDINESGSLTTFDLVLAMKTLEQVDETPITQHAWKFISQEAILSNGSAVPISCCTMLITDLQNDLLSYNIYGVKKGDVNNSVIID